MIMTWLQSLLRSRTGNALVTALIASGIITGVGVVVINRSTASVRQMQQSAEADQAWYLAMAGIEEAMAKLRWDGTSWKNLKTNPVTATGSLAGGTYSATATYVAGTTGRIVSTGSYGRFSRKLIGVVQWQNDETSPGSMSLYGGGNWRFSGNSNVEGNIATTGDIVWSGSSLLCGQAHAKGTITSDNGPMVNHLKAGCGSVPVEHSDVVVAYSDDWDGPYDRVETGDYTFKNTDEGDDVAWSYFKVDGVAEFPTSGITFERTVKIVAGKGFVIRGPIKATPGHWVFLYTMSAYGGAPVLPGGGTGSCPTITGSPHFNDVGSSLAMWVDQSTHTDVVMWARDGGIFFKGSGSGAVYGKVYGSCVTTEDNWNFYPGSDLPGGTCTVGCASSLRLTALYEPNN